MGSYILKTANGGFVGTQGGGIIKFYGDCSPGEIKFRFSDSTYNPNVIQNMYEHTWTRISSVTNDWLYYQASTVFWQAFYNAFRDANNLVTILDSNLENVTDISQIFEGCTSLQNSDLKNTGSVTNMYHAFYNCTSMSSISPYLDTSSVTNMGGAFLDCPITSIPSSLDTSSAVNLWSTFAGTNITSIPSTISISSARTIKRIFSHCTEVNSGITEFYNKALAINKKPSFMFSHDSDEQSPDVFYLTGSNSVTGDAEARATSYDYTGVNLTGYSTPHDGNVRKLRSKIVMVTPLRLTWSGLRILSSTQYPSSATHEMCARWYKSTTNVQTQQKYGLFYNWPAIEYLINNPSVISGWHIPSKSEYETIIDDFGGRTELGWEFIRYMEDFFPDDPTHIGLTGYDGYFAGYSKGGSSASVWTYDGTELINWTRSTSQNNRNVFFSVNKSNGNATYREMDFKTDDNCFAQLVLFKD